MQHCPGQVAASTPDHSKSINFQKNMINKNPWHITKQVLNHTVPTYNILNIQIRDRLSHGMSTSHLRLVDIPCESELLFKEQTCAASASLAGHIDRSPEFAHRATLLLHLIKQLLSHSSTFNLLPSILFTTPSALPTNAL